MLLATWLLPDRHAVVVDAAGTTSGSVQNRAVASTFEVQLGPEEAVFGPSGIIDTPYFSERNASGELVGFTGNAVSYEFRSAGNVALSKRRTIVAKGARGRFDGCGAWLSSIYKVPLANGAASAHWVGWYHAEAPSPGTGGACDYAAGTTTWRVAYVESRDSGRTWTKSNYPDNKVITQDAGLSGPLVQDAGNPRVIRIGSYLYMYFQAATRANPVRQLNVARAPASTLGRPGSWSKWYCAGSTPDTCGFTQPGIGGRSTGLRNISAMSRFVTWNSYLGRYIATQVSGRAGFSLRVAEELGSSQVPMTWSSAATIYPAVSTVDDPKVDKWGSRDASAAQLYAYPSLLATDGSSSRTAQSFYMYYMKIFPGDGFDRRYLFRRKVSLKLTDTVPRNRVQLTTYVDATGHRRTTTERPKSFSYHVQTSAGYLLSVSRPDTLPVFECASGAADDVLAVNECPDGRAPLRRVGWILPQKSTEFATVAIYSCYDTKLARHFASTAYSCSGARRDGLLGYGLPAFA